MYKSLLPSLLFFAVLFSACFESKNPKILDLRQSPIQAVEFNRYDQLFFSADTNQIVSSLQSIRAKDTTFFDTYTMQMMRFGKLSDTSLAVAKHFRAFFTNPDIRTLQDSVNLSFENPQAISEELTEAFRYFHHYFPHKTIPKIYTVLSEFNYKAVTFDSATLVLCLDMYLGKNSIFYQRIQMPSYMSKRFGKEYIAPDAMEVLYNQYFSKSEWAETNALIYEMIENGKKLYFLESMLPQKAKHLLIGYTPEQLAWCEKSEANIWAFYNEKDLFYNKSYKEHKKHISDTPKTAGMPSEAPGNVGSWVGWQIVNKYMQNSKATLPQLLQTDAETILHKSKYKPL